MLTIMILVLMVRLFNALHQFLMESAIYGVLDQMILIKRFCWRWRCWCW